tara:strand:- start:118 stop:516 length:399 start_codon:yes stop_codon:yes gene_type:complete
MSYNIAINIKLKNNLNVSGNENLIYDIANNLNSKYIYYDYELEGVNKYIKKNNKIMIIEFENNNDLYNFIKIIKTIKETIIDYIYYENNIIYGSKNYLNNLNDTFISKNELINKIEKNKLNNDFKNILNLLN